MIAPNLDLATRDLLVSKPDPPYAALGVIMITSTGKEGLVSRLGIYYIRYRVVRSRDSNASNRISTRSTRALCVQ